MTFQTPRHQGMLDRQGKPTVPYARFFDEIARRVTDVEALATIPRPEDFGAAGDGTTDDTAAMQRFFANSSGFGRLSDGATYLVDADAITVPGSTHWFGPRSATIKNADATGYTITLAEDDVRLEGFTVDGGNSSGTIAAGYLIDHVGIAVTGTTSDYVTNVHISGMTVVNCGYTGIDLYYAQNSTVMNCAITRCGYGGIASWSGLFQHIVGNNVSDIYPGETPGVDGSNCYGIVMSRYGSEARPTYIWVDSNAVSRVTWEGIDEHDGQFIWFTNNVVTDCGQGIVAEHHTSGAPARKITIHGNTIVGYETRVVESVTYRSIGGIVCGGALAAEQGQLLSICDNTIESCGDTRSVSGDGGAISCRNWRNFAINSNRILAAYKAGIIVYHSTTDTNFFGTINDNTVDATNTVAGVARDIYVSGNTAALITGNFAAGGGDGFNQAGAPTYVSSITGNYLYS